MSKFSCKEKSIQEHAHALDWFEKHGYTCKNCTHYPCPAQDSEPEYLKPICFSFNPSRIRPTK